MPMYLEVKGYTATLLNRLTLRSYYVRALYVSHLMHLPPKQSRI